MGIGPHSSGTEWQACDRAGQWSFDIYKHAGATSDCLHIENLIAGENHRW